MNEMDEKTREDLFMQIAKIAHQLGWVAAFEDIEDDEDVHGIFIGDKDYIVSLMNKLDNPHVLMEKREDA